MRGLPKYARVISLAFAFFACGSRVDAAEAVYSEIHERRQQEILGLTLDDAIALAVRDNRGIQTAYLQRVAQKFDLYVSEGKFFPKLTLTTGILDNKAAGLSSRTKDITTNGVTNGVTGSGLSFAHLAGVG